MGVRSFIDSNILVYTDDQDSPEKQKAALDLIEEARLQRSGVISTQGPTGILRRHDPQTQGQAGNRTA